MLRDASVDFVGTAQEIRAWAAKHGIAVKINPQILQNGCLEADIWGEQDAVKAALIEYNGGDEDIEIFYNN